MAFNHRDKFDKEPTMNEALELLDPKELEKM